MDFNSIKLNKRHKVLLSISLARSILVLYYTPFNESIHQVAWIIIGWFTYFFHNKIRHFLIRLCGIGSIPLGYFFLKYGLLVLFYPLWLISLPMNFIGVGGSTRQNVNKFSQLSFNRLSTRVINEDVGFWQADYYYYGYFKLTNNESQSLLKQCKDNTNYTVFNGDIPLILKHDGMEDMEMRRISYSSGDIGCYRTNPKCNGVGENEFEDGMCHSELNATKGEFSILRVGD